jgi:hypothetical protein
MNLLATCRDPRAVAAICPVFLLPEGADRADVATIAMIEMIPKVPGFSREVYQWDRELAKGLYYFSRLIFREWWKANSVQFLRQDYLSVKPGALPPKGGFEVVQAPDGTYHMRLFAEASDWTPSAAGAALASPPATKSATPSSRNTDNNQGTSKNRGIYILAILLFIPLSITAFYYAIRRR